MYSKTKSYKGSRFSKSSYVVKKDERRLLNAASRNDCDRLTALLECGVNPNACDENGRTALHLASASGYSKIVNILLNYNADCGVVDKLGNTPLHLAACTFSASTINCLLNAGSSLQRDHNGCTPLELAQTKLRALLPYHNADYTELKLEMSGIVEKMKVLLDCEEQEKKLSELFSSGMLLNENSTDVNPILNTLKDLEL